MYGDSAILLDQSDLIGAIAGGWSLFGLPSGFYVSTNLVCGGTTAGMISLPLHYSQPSIIDVHAYPLTQAIATLMYSDAWSLLSYRGLTSNVLMVGETQSNQNCDGYTAAMAPTNVAGYAASTLYTNHAGANHLTNLE